MPKQINVRQLQQKILAQTQPFTPADIAQQIDVSSSRAYQEIREMIAKGRCLLDHKQGHTMFYSVAGRMVGAPVAGDAAPAVKVNGMMDLLPAERMGYIKDCTSMVIEKITPSVLITGIAGVGKTFLVRNQLEKMGKVDGDTFHFVQGHSSPMGLYRWLYEHRDSTTVFDDCDSVFKDEVAVNLLKCALDSYDVRKVSWVSSRLPEDLESSFDFTGSIIFISNMDACRIDSAILSRTMVIDLQMSRQEICEYLESILPQIQPTDMSLEHKCEVLVHLREICDSLSQMNLRTFIKACRVFKACELNQGNWKKMLQVLDN